MYLFPMICRFDIHFEDRFINFIEFKIVGRTKFLIKGFKVFISVLIAKMVISLGASVRNVDPVKRCGYPAQSKPKYS
jgi:hypothetical protein